MAFNRQDEWRPYDRTSPRCPPLSLSPCQDKTWPVIDRMNGDLDLIGPVPGVHHPSLSPCQDNTWPVIDRMNGDLDLKDQSQIDTVNGDILLDMTGLVP